MSKIILNEGNFQNEVINRKNLILVDFWAEWCAPCRALSPILDEILLEYNAKNFNIGKLNVDENPKISATYQVLSIPTMLFFKEGKIVDQLVGLNDKNTIKQKIDLHI